jgi:hypothetical protein
MNLKHLSPIKKLLLLNFLLLLIFQIVIGFKDLDDYLVIFVFVLFLNDLYFKLTKPMPTLIHEEKRKRIWVSMFLLLLIVHKWNCHHNNYNLLSQYAYQ